FGPEVRRQLRTELLSQDLRQGLRGSGNRDQGVHVFDLSGHDPDQRALAMPDKADAGEARVLAQPGSPGRGIVDISVEPQVLLPGPGRRALPDTALVVADGRDATLRKPFREQPETVVLPLQER